MRKRSLNVDWRVVDGAAKKKRIVKLETNKEKKFECPVMTCLHYAYNSSRGLRKHINSVHPWYYYFDEQPRIQRQKAFCLPKKRMKCSTHSIPAFTLESGFGKDFLEWLMTPCGGGKVLNEAVQSGRRAMKFLYFALGEPSTEVAVQEDYVDCCVGSPSVIIKFLKTITEEWELSSSGALNYLKSLKDLMDYRKSSGVTDNVLRTFTAAEVYIRRGKENLAKMKKLDYSRNLDLESLIAANSWASLEEMEKVIPFHTDQFRHITERCKGTEERPTINDLAFATRFIITFLFLRVKCTRPMTYKFLTLTQIDAAKSNGGYVDQTTFKTQDKYIFDTLVLSEDVLSILAIYIKVIRPLMNPSCEYVLVTTNGTQYTAFGTAMRLLVHQAIGKSVNPTRYRMIVESESALRLTTSERDTVSKDQKHGSSIAKRIYQKRLSRDIAVDGLSCIQKLVGGGREQHNAEIVHTLTRSDRPNPDSTVSAPTDNEVTLLSDDNKLNESDSEMSTTHGVKDAGATEEIIYIADTLNEVANLLKENSTAKVDDIGENVCVQNDLLKEHSADKVDDIGENVGIQDEKPEEVPVTTEVHYAEPVVTSVSTSLTTSICTKSNDVVSTTAPVTVNVIPLHLENVKTVQSLIVEDHSNSSADVTMDVEVKKEQVERELAVGVRMMRFTPEEDIELKKGISKYGLSHWSKILKDDSFQFHASRTRDSLRMRADTLGIGKNKRKPKARSCKTVKV